MTQGTPVTGANFIAAHGEHRRVAVLISVPGPHAVKMSTCALTAVATPPPKITLLPIVAVPISDRPTYKAATVITPVLVSKISTVDDTVVEHAPPRKTRTFRN